MSPNRPDHVTDEATALQLHIRRDGSANLGITAGERRFDIPLTADLVAELTYRLNTDTPATHLRAVA